MEMTNISNAKKNILYYCLIIFNGSILILYLIIMHRLGNIFIYPMDDTYIHLSIAKNLADFGVWGITPYEFSSCISSPSFTLIIALFYRIFHTVELFPFVLNIIIGNLIIVIIYQIFSKYLTNRFISNLFILSPLLIPIPSLVFSGFEHLTHILFVILLIYIFYFRYRFLERADNKSFAIMSILAFLATSFRYESIFLVFSLSVVLFFKKHYWRSFIINIASFLPIIIYGVISTKNGALFFPSSIVLKTSLVFLHDYSISKIMFYNILKVFHNKVLTIFWVFLIFEIYLLIRSKRINNKSFLLLLITFGTTIFHLVFAATGQFFRYEAYIYLLFLITQLTLYYENKDLLFELKSYTKLGFYILIFLISTTILYRSGKSLYINIIAPTNIYQQQIQMARFIKKYYNTDAVAIHDIGAISFYTNIKIIDVAGNASVELLKGNISDWAMNIDSLMKKRNSKIAITYKFDNLPSNWIEIGYWEIQNNVICGDEKVYFYATTQNSVYNLKKNLVDFQNKLPIDVICKIY